MSCGNQHPTDSTARCAKSDERHELCAGWSAAEGEMSCWANSDYEPPKTTPRRAARPLVTEMASRVARAPSVHDRAAEAHTGAARATQRWTDEQRRAVFDAVLAVARDRTRFTTDDIWAHLGEDFPVTMGIAAVLRRAVGAGHIRPTSDTVYSRRDRTDHDHGRHLRVWELTGVER